MILHFHYKIFVNYYGVIRYINNHYNISGGNKAVGNH